MVWWLVRFKNLGKDGEGGLNDIVGNQQSNLNLNSVSIPNGRMDKPTTDDL